MQGRNGARWMQLHPIPTLLSIRFCLPVRKTSKGTLPKRHRFLHPSIRTRRESGRTDVAHDRIQE